MKIRRAMVDHDKAASMTPGKLQAAYKRNHADSMALTSHFVDIGRGDWRGTDIEAKAEEGDALSLQHVALAAEARAIRYGWERKYGPDGMHLLRLDSIKRAFSQTGRAVNRHSVFHVTLDRLGTLGKRAFHLVDQIAQLIG